MHELSIAQSVVSTVRDALGDRRVLTVNLRVGLLAGVVPQALTFGWELATEGTSLAGARLVIEQVPLAARCIGCGAGSEHLTPPPLRCPECDGSCMPLQDGRTLEVRSVEVADDGEYAEHGREDSENDLENDRRVDVREDVKEDVRDHVMDDGEGVTAAG